jgi:hypothetical protein
MPRKKITTIETDGDEALADAEPPARHETVSSSPFFAAIGDESEEVLDHIVISREKPIREGQLGKLPPDASEDDVREQFGGGSFRLMGRTERNKPIKGAFTTIELAGDPIFTNEVSRKRWLKIKREQLGEDPEARPQVDIEDIREARHQRELAKIKAEAEAAVAKAKAEAEARDAAEERRRSREREEREAERQREREERRAEALEREEREEARRKREREEERQERAERMEAEERRWKAEMEERRAEREKKSDPAVMLMQAMKIGAELAGNGAEFPDAGTAFVAKMPEIFDGFRGIIGDAAAAGAFGSNGHRKKLNPAPKNGATEKVELEGALAEKAKKTAIALQKAGVKDVGKVMASEMNRAFDRLSAVREVKATSKKSTAKARK